MISQPAILTNHRTPFTLLESFSFGTLMGAENIHASRFTRLPRASAAQISSF